MPKTESISGYLGAAARRCLFAVAAVVVERERDAVQHHGQVRVRRPGQRVTRRRKSDRIPSK
ncbi:hypothetical protein EYF80_041083 [Liparis tanakae]|uniref:Uncharacterized protein n=1 Tax=Liparis tanakae TaxID=230148 RepID=A0A4Z2G6K3_9TELE|nr:hypothetical protein EYF80_041083 [Liparis tanakae]